MDNIDQDEQMRILDELLYLSQHPGAIVEAVALAWMMSMDRKFARPQTIAEDGVTGGFVITQDGIDWLSRTKHTEFSRMKSDDQK